MQIKNVSPYGDLDVPLLRRIVTAGEVVDVDDALAAVLLAQPEAWAPVDARGEQAADAAAATLAQVNADAGNSPADQPNLDPAEGDAGSDTGADTSAAGADEGQKDGESL